MPQSHPGSEPDRAPAALTGPPVEAMAVLQAIGARCANAASSVQECLEGILDAAITLTAADRGNIQLFDPASRTLKIVAHRGFEEPFLRHFAVVDRDEAAACARAMVGSRRVAVDDVSQSEIFASTPALAVLLEANVRSVQSTPLVSTAGAMLGMISTHFSKPQRWDERDLRPLDLLARQSADYLERNRAERDLAAAHEALKERNQRKDEFLATLAHELRNPLAPVLNAAHFLKLKEIADPDVRRSVDMIERQVKHMARLIDDLVDMSRISRGALDVRFARHELAGIVAAAAEAYHGEIEGRGHSLAVELPPGPVVLEVDRDRLVQMLGNLLSNAAKYTPAQGRIVLTARIDEPEVVISVTDNGIGIPLEKLSAIFELFVQLDRRPGRGGGLGIGLALTRQIVELHHGTIEAKSEGLGRGSTFVVRLPLRAGTSAPPVAAEQPREVRPHRVLIADDNADVVESLAQLLRKRAHSVCIALDGEAAFEAAAAFRPDVAILDVGMPRLDGYELARQIRREPWGRAMRLIAVTGYGHGRDRQRAKQAGFDVHLVKPVSVEALFGAIGES